MDNNKKDFVYNKHPKTEKKQSNSVSFYIVLALIVFCVLGSVLGSFAFVENRVKADEVPETYIDPSFQCNTTDYFKYSTIESLPYMTQRVNSLYNLSGSMTFYIELPFKFYFDQMSLSQTSSLVDFDNNFTWYLTHRLGYYNFACYDSYRRDYVFYISVPDPPIYEQAYEDPHIYTVVYLMLQFTNLDFDGTGVAPHIPTFGGAYTYVNPKITFDTYNTVYESGYNIGYQNGLNDGQSQFTNDLGLFQFSNNYIQANYGGFSKPWEDTKYPFIIEDIFGIYYGGFYGSPDSNLESLVDKYSIPTEIDDKSLSRLLLTFDFSTVNGGLGLRLSEYPILNFVYKNYDGSYDFSTHTYEETCEYGFYYGDGTIFYTDPQVPLTTMPFDTSKSYLKKITVEVYGVDSYIYGMFSGGANPIANSAYQNGYTRGYEIGYSDGDWSGYNFGYNKGYNAGVDSSGNYSFLSLISAVVDVPVKAFTSLFNFEVFEVNLSGFFFFLLTFAVVLKVIALIK